MTVTELHETLRSMNHRIGELEKVIGLTVPESANVGYLRAKRIIEAVSRNFGDNLIYSRNNTSRGVRQRQIAWYLIRKHCILSFPDMGRLFRNKSDKPLHHTTVMYGVEHIEDLIATDQAMRSAVEAIEKEIGL